MPHGTLPGSTTHPLKNQEENNLPVVQNRWSSVISVMAVFCASMLCGKIDRRKAERNRGGTRKVCHLREVEKARRLDFRRELNRGLYDVP